MASFVPPAALTQVKETPVSIEYEAEWAHLPVWTQWRIENHMPWPWIETRPSSQ
jgi:hypothetical protein